MKMDLTNVSGKNSDDTVTRVRVDHSSMVTPDTSIFADFPPSLVGTIFAPLMLMADADVPDGQGCVSRWGSDVVLRQCTDIQNDSKPNT